MKAMNQKYKSINRGFTLIELIVVIAIIAVLSGVILFSITQYIARGKDSNIQGNLAILVPAGEDFYDGNGGSYNDGTYSFCDPNVNSVIKTVISQMPQGDPNGSCACGNGCDLKDPNTWTATSNPAGICCYAPASAPVLGQAWAACAQEFANTSDYYCVDSRGLKEEVPGKCTPSDFATLTQCPS